LRMGFRIGMRMETATTMTTLVMTTISANFR